MFTQSFIRQHLAAINSATKYPSIPTYHALGDKGRLLEETNASFDGPVHVSEKIDGTNVRIVVLPCEDGRPVGLVGSREELLTATDDLVHNPALGIVDGVREVAERAIASSVDGVLVVFGELFGGRVTAGSKQYTSKRDVAFRVFDVISFPSATFTEVVGWDGARISAWREGGGQPFLALGDVDAAAARIGALRVPTLTSVPALPGSIAETHEWLRTITGERSRATLDPEAGGKPEGVVVRDDKRKIAKVRFEDYERTLGKRGR